MNGRLRATLVATATLVVVGGATAAAFGFGATPQSTPKASSLPATTARVQRGTLVDTEQASGTLDHGPTTTVSSRLAGTVTGLAATGSTVDRGKVLYTVDNQPVVLMYGSLPAYRTLAVGAEGPDVKQLEQNLAALGYTGFAVDTKYTESTATAVRKWQKALGLAETGIVDLGRVFYATGPVRVNAQNAAPGDQTGPGQAVLTVTGTARVVTVKLDPAQQRLAVKGREVRVVLPDGKTAVGTISDVTTVIETGSGNNQATTKIRVTVAVGDQNAVAGYDQASVDVRFTADERKDVLSVPVAALLALSEGGYGLQVVEGDGTRIVAVETGLFANGRVEVRGDGIADGTVVGMPS